MIWPQLAFYLCCCHLSLTLNIPAILNFWSPQTCLEGTSPAFIVITSPLSDCFLKLSLWLTLAWICYPSSFWLWENLTMYFLVLWTLIPEHLWIFVGAVLFINTIQSSNPWKWLEEKDIIFCISCSPGLKQGTVLNEWLNKQMNTCFYVPL